MFEGMDIPWVSALNPIKKKKSAPPPQPAPKQEDDITEWGPAGFELLKRILARALAPFPAAARSVGAHLRANAQALFNYGLPIRPIDYDAMIVAPQDHDCHDLELAPAPAA
jgi:hypothetical protein